jgi:hypothetical protein
MLVPNIVAGLVPNPLVRARTHTHTHTHATSHLLSLQIHFHSTSFLLNQPLSLSLSLSLARALYMHSFTPSYTHSLTRSRHFRAHKHPHPHKRHTHTHTHTCTRTADQKSLNMNNNCGEGEGGNVAEASGLVPAMSAVSPWNLGTSQSLDVSPILFAETTRNEEAMEGYEQGEEEEEGEGDSDTHAPRHTLVHAHRTHIANVEIPDWGFVPGDQQHDSAGPPVSAIRMQADAPYNSARVVSTVFSRLAQPKARDGNVRKCVPLCVFVCLFVHIRHLYSRMCIHRCTRILHTHVHTRKQGDPSCRSGSHGPQGSVTWSKAPGLTYHIYTHACAYTKSKAVTKATAP